MKSKLPLIIVAVLVIAIIAVVLFVFVFNGEEKAIPIVRTEFSPGDYFVVNLKDSTRLLKATVVMVLNTDTLEEYMLERASLIRDSINSVLRDQDEATMRSIDLSGVKEEIRVALNEKLEIDNITDILLTDIAVQ